MSILRDANYLSQMAKQLGISDSIEEDVARQILSEVEKTMRLIIYVNPYSAASSESQKFDFFSSSVHSARDDEAIDVKQLLQQELSLLQNKVEPPSIQLWWVSKDGQFIDSTENQYFTSKNEQQKKYELSEIEKQKQFNLIRDRPLDLLSQELYNFFTFITEQIAREELLLDQQLYAHAQMGESPQIKSVQDCLRSAGGLNALVPFLINFFFQDFDSVVKNGCWKKLIIVRMLKALLLNSTVNLESQLHLIIKMLIHYTTARDLSLSMTENDVPLRHESAILLANLMLANSSKYQTLQQNMCSTIREILDAALSQKQVSHQQASQIGAMLNFFLQLDYLTLKQNIQPYILRICNYLQTALPEHLQSVASRKIQYQKPPSNKDNSDEIIIVNNELANTNHKIDQKIQQSLEIYKKSEHKNQPSVLVRQIKQLEEALNYLNEIFQLLITQVYAKALQTHDEEVLKLYRLESLSKYLAPQYTIEDPHSNRNDTIFSKLALSEQINPLRDNYLQNIL